MACGASDCPDIHECYVKKCPAQKRHVQIHDNASFSASEALKLWVEMGTRALHHMKSLAPGPSIHQNQPLYQLEKGVTHQNSPAYHYQPVKA